MVSIILIILAAIANSVMDCLKFRFYKSVFNQESKRWYGFVEPMSWLNKWKNRDVKQGEAYWLSSTVLVFTTDLWHLAQMIMITSFLVAIVVYDPLVHWGVDFNVFGLSMEVAIDRLTDLVIFKVVFSLTFETFFSKILLWKK